MLDLNAFSNRFTLNRRQLLRDATRGLAGIAAGAILSRDGRVRGEETGPQKPVVRRDGPAKQVIWIFLAGGLSHLESFDPKPAVNEHAGKSITETPFASVLDSPFSKSNLREVIAGLHHSRKTLFPMQVGYRPRGESGLLISDWFPHLAEQADDLAVVRSMWTTDNDHGAQLQFHTGRHILEGSFPTIGSWIHYGLGLPADNLPSFVVLGTPIADCCGGIGAHGANYLGPEHSGIRLRTDPTNPLSFSKPGYATSTARQKAEFDLVRQLNRIALDRQPFDTALEARIKSYELAFAMQTAVPEAVDIASETRATQELYGLQQPETEPFGRQCLVARRLVQRGVKFVQIFHGVNGAAGEWDAHSGLKDNHARNCLQVDRPIAGLIADLKRLGLLEETLLVIATEFGRTAGSEGSDGRDHHPFGFSIAMAGGGLKGGIAHGSTDELGFHAVENRHYVTDVHATVLHQMGLDPHAMEIPGRKRLEIDFGEPMHAIIA